MVSDRSKGRGKFENPIELKYIQVPHDVYRILTIDLRNIDEVTRKEVLWFYFNNYFTNNGYETLKLTNPTAYGICSMLDSMTYSAQNNARWRCFDEFYEGRDDIDFEMASDLYKKKVKEKKSLNNKKQYARRKQENYDPEREEKEGLKNFRKALDAQGIEYNPEDLQ